MNWRVSPLLVLSSILFLGCEATDTPIAPQVGDGDVALGDTAADTAGAARPGRCDTLGCDDGLSCTIDTCDMDTLLCSWDLLPQSCLLGGACVSQGSAHPVDDCLFCDAARDPFAWTVIEGCVDAPPDGPVEGASCDDQDPCTQGDVWMADICTGTPIQCPDQGPCLTGVCDPLSTDLCTLMPAEGPCQGDDACHQAGTCVEGTCVSAGPVECDDQNPCTLDHCDALAGCVNLPKQSPCCVGIESLCEDDNPCTDDSCDPVTAACEHVPNTEPCDDGDACTVDNTCAEGSCQGSLKDCDDDNPCTDDFCSAESGCLTANLTNTPCDDELECSTGDTCEEGVCVADTSQCVCELVEPMDAVRFIDVALGQGGHPGEALDIDGDVSTCAPASDCSDGHNNALGLIASFANEALQDAVDSGDLLLVASFNGADSGSFLLGVYQAEALDNACDPQSASCELLLDPSSVETGTCAPLIQMPATVSGGLLEAGGPGSLFPFTLPLSAGANLDVVLHDTQIQGTLTQGADGVSAFEGVVGGAIPKAALSAAIDALPSENLPVDKALIEAVMGAVEADIDTTGDGVGDASSIGFKVVGVDTFVSGFAD